MTTTVVTFPAARIMRSASHLPRQAAANIVSLEIWKRRAHPHRTANGVFFTTQVLSTTGDFA